MPREKSRYRDRRSSSSSSESSYEQRKKTKHKRRSRSRDRSESSSHRRKRSTSRSRHKRRSYSRSLSRERYDKYRKRSKSRSRSRRERSHSRSHSRSKSKFSKSSKKSRRRSRSASSGSSSREVSGKQYLTVKPKHDDTDIKIEKAIKAAEAAGLTLTKIPTYEYKEVEVKEDMPTIHDRNLLEELNSESFVQKTFTSSRKKDTNNIVIELENDLIKLPENEAVMRDDESIIDLSEIPDENELVEMWIKKLYQLRKRMLKGEI